MILLMQYWSLHFNELAVLGLIAPSTTGCHYHIEYTSVYATPTSAERGEEHHQ